MIAALAICGATIVGLGLIGVLDGWRLQRARDRRIAAGDVTPELGYCRAELEAVAMAAVERSSTFDASPGLQASVARLVLVDLEQGTLPVDELADRFRSASASRSA